MKDNDYLRACLLLIVGKEQTHGYQINKDLAVFGIKPKGPPVMYRMLRKMEKEGLLHSTMVESPVGPKRRNYALTEAGQAELDGLALGVMSRREGFSNFLEVYEEEDT